MKKLFRPLTALLAITITMFACSSSFSVVGTQPPSPTNVIVQTGAPTIEASTVLPRPLYFLGKDSQSLTQVYRIETNGGTPTQITHESIAVTYYDVSFVDGSIAYVASNQLLLANADGSNRRVLIDGGSSSDLRGNYNPVFSPDGKTLAYSQNGLILYDVVTGTSNLALQDQPLGGSLPPELYIPDKFSPDGKKLLLKVGHPPDSPWSAAIYTISTKTLTRIASENESLSCCDMYGGAEWSADGSNLYAVATTPDATTPFGELWKIDSTSGTVTTLIPGSAGEGAAKLFYLPYKPYPAPDGQLYFFSAKFPESAGYFRRAPLLLIRSSPTDIITNWTVLRLDTFELMNEALWAPDASFVIVALAPTKDDYNGGQAEIVYLDGRPNVVLTPSAQQMKWGS
jgi:Tol biopolymer transport system component